MTARTLVQTCARVAIALLVGIVFLALGAILDLPASEEQAVADDAASAWMDSRNLARRDAIAQVLCDSELGPGTQVLWTREGDLVCRPAAQVFAKGGAL